MTGTGLIDIVNGIANVTVNNLVAELVLITMADTQGTGLDVTSNQDLLWTPGPAVDIVFTDPPDNTVGNPVTVNLRALDAFGNLDYNFESDDSLNLTGSATGGGLIDIVAGVADVPVNNGSAQKAAGKPLVIDPAIEAVRNTLA